MARTRSERNAYLKEWQRKNPEKIQGYRSKYTKELRDWTRADKIAKGCENCGYHEHHAALEYHHILPRLRGPVGLILNSGRPAVLEEIERCIVLCSNCHGIVTFENREKGGSE